MTYEEYRNARQKEVDSLPIFFAFGNDQFAEQMRKRGLTENDTDKIYRLKGVSGGFYLRKDADTIRDFFAKPDPLAELMKDKDFALDAFYYEMCNHEYGINWQADWDVCSCFGHCKYQDDKDYRGYLKEMDMEDLIPVYKAAKNKYWRDAEENDWF